MTSNNNSTDDGSLSFLNIQPDEANKHFNCPETTQQKLINLQFWLIDFIEDVKTKFGANRFLVKIKFKKDDPESEAKKFCEFDVISDQYIAQAKPPLKCVNKTVRTQMKATFEAAKKYERKVYYQFEGIPSQEVLDKLYEYSERYGVEVIIDTEPLGILN